MKILISGGILVCHTGLNLDVGEPAISLEYKDFTENLPEEECGQVTELASSQRTENMETRQCQSPNSLGERDLLNPRSQLLRESSKIEISGEEQYKNQKSRYQRGIATPPV